MVSTKDKERIGHICNLLHASSRPIRILTTIGWPLTIKQRFFEQKAAALPQPQYPSFDLAPTIENVNAVRSMLNDSPIDNWLTRIADNIEKSAYMLSSVGSQDFFHFSGELYGTPRSVLLDGINTPLDLATQFNSLIDTFNKTDLGEPRPARNAAQTVADEMTVAVKNMFGKNAPDVFVVDELSANALAGPRRIRIRRAANFTDNDIQQLIQHEAYIHVATAINGIQQTNLKILSASHPGTTRTQEGLAVFAEFITGTMDLDRMRRLADRVIAIQMAIDGADFIEVYHYFLERTGNEDQSFESTRRVFRGGTVTGGAPFTKDIVYLDGLLRVHNFLRAIVTAGRVDCLRMLFCGKLDLEDIPVLFELKKMGLCKDPQYLPPWAADLRFLLSYLSYSSFLNRIDMNKVNAHYDKLLADVPTDI